MALVKNTKKTFVLTIWMDFGAVILTDQLSSVSSADKYILARTIGAILEQPTDASKIITLNLIPI